MTYNINILGSITTPRRDLIPVVLFVVSIVTYTHFCVPVLFTQDECAVFASALSLICDGDLTYINDNNLRFETNVIAPSFVSYRSESDLYYTTFFGTSLYFMPSVLYFSSDYYIFFPILSSFSILLIYLISRKLCRSDICATIASIALIFMPIFVNYSISYFNQTYMVFFFLISFYVILLDISPTKKLLFSVFFSICAVIIRIDAIFYFILYVTCTFWVVKSRNDILSNKKFLTYYVLLMAFLPITICLISYAFSGSIFYDPHLTTYAYIPQKIESIDNVYKNYDESIIEKLLSYVLGTESSVYGFSLPDFIYIKYFHITYFLHSKFASPFLYVSIVGLVIASYNKKYRFFSFFVLLLFLAGLILSARTLNYYGSGDMTLRSAFLRYNLLIYSFSSIFIGIVAKSLLTYSNRKSFKIYILAYLFIIILVSSLFSSISPEFYGIEKHNLYRSQQLHSQNDLKYTLNYSENALLITDFYIEKFVYTISNDINYEDINNLNFIKNWYIYDYVTLYIPMINSSLELIDDWLNCDQPVYAYYSKNTYPQQDFFFETLSETFKLKKVYEDSEIIVWGVMHKDPDDI